MKRIALYLFGPTIFICIFSFNSFGQTIDPLRFFPQSVGNKWHWVDRNDGSTYTQEVTRDSVASNGKKYIFCNNSPVPNYQIDTLFQVFQYQNRHYQDGHFELGEPVLLFKLNAAEGDSFSTPWGNVKVSTFNVTVFGKTTIAKRYTWYINGVYRNDRMLAYGFGEIEGYASPSIILLDQHITGCIIDGVAYGILLSVESIAEASPNQYDLCQNYPNPFNPATTIKYSLPQSGYTSLKIYNALGKEVATLSSEQQSSGVHQKTWDASQMPSGTYFCRLQSGSFSATKKLILLR